MFDIINTMKKHYALLYHARTYNIKKSRFESGPQSTICSHTPVET